ncbi:hypothetical protein L1280_001854 [Deinococcus sp. HSC-46F16]|uniref:hypothetical protein n=1 Tax=Deinococcus sp. HSC-46F16 TaxID=2910968 RepID=UPI0020A067CF|nr:hypothetical protein [Deinococcus sp. HSC-46F16]MCP2014703.1 hypothetical protein [Deinococcus sp. HSC-46F16]
MNRGVSPLSQADPDYLHRVPRTPEDVSDLLHMMVNISAIFQPTDDGGQSDSAVFVRQPTGMLTPSKPQFDLFTTQVLPHEEIELAHAEAARYGAVLK